MADFEVKDGIAVIPEGTVNIVMYAFEGREDLMKVVIPDSVVEIGTCAFRNCINLELVILPESLQIIGASAFSGCTNLKSVVIPDSVTEIGGGAFYDIGLSEITIPKSVKTIGSSAFGSNINLKTITFLGWVRSNPFDPFNYCDSIESIYVPAKKGDSYKKRVPWYNEKLREFIIELPEEKKVKKTKGKNKEKYGGKYYLTLDGTYLQMKRLKLSQATDDRIECFINNEKKSSQYSFSFVSQILTQLNKLNILEDATSDGSPTLRSFMEKGDDLYEGSYIIDADEDVNVYLYSAPDDIDEKSFKEEKPVLGGSAIKKALKKIKFKNIPKVHYEWGYESDMPDQANDEPEDFNANKLASEISGLGEKHHLLNDFIFSQGWHVITVNDWSAANRPTTFLITTEEPFDIKRLQLIIVEVEELTNFYNWSLVAGAIYDNKLLPVVGGNPTEWGRINIFFVKVSENGGYNEKAYDVRTGEWNS